MAQAAATPKRQVTIDLNALQAVAQNIETTINSIASQYTELDAQLVTIEGQVAIGDLKNQAGGQLAAFIATLQQISGNINGVANTYQGTDGDAARQFGG
ncbi:Fc.00g001460.m01.CDS01 [Cosmosporella sp. VM-42]